MNRIQKQQEQAAISETERLIVEAKSNWLDAWLAKLMPPEVYELAKTNSGGDRKKIRHWMLDNKLELRDLPDRTELWRGEQKVGDFMVTIENGKLNFVSKDYMEPEGGDVE